MGLLLYNSPHFIHTKVVISPPVCYMYSISAKVRLEIEKFRRIEWEVYWLSLQSATENIEGLPTEEQIVQVGNRCCSTRRGISRNDGAYCG